MSMYSSLSLFHSDQRDPFYFTFFFFPFPGPTTHYYFPFPFLSFLLQRVSDLDRHLPIDDFPEDNAPQILDDPIGSSLPHLLGRVRRREPHDLETRSLAGPDARGRVLEDEDRRILAQAQARPPQQVAPRVRLADLDVLRDDKEPGLRELEHLEPAGDQGARAGRDHAPGGARGLQRLEEMPRAGDLDGVLAEFLGDETLYVTDIWRSRMRYKRMNEPVMIKRSFIFFSPSSSRGPRGGAGRQGEYGQEQLTLPVGPTRVIQLDNIDASPPVGGRQDDFGVYAQLFSEPFIDKGDESDRATSRRIPYQKGKFLSVGSLRRD